LEVAVARRKRRARNRAERIPYAIPSPRFNHIGVACEDFYKTRNIKRKMD
jgi:hypothetical protein